MSKRKVPQPVYLMQPDGIIDLTYKGYPFRIELHGCAGRFPRFKFFSERGSREFNLYEILTSGQLIAFWDAVALWNVHNERAEDPDPEMPHKAIFKVLDLIVDYLKQKQEQEREVVKYKSAFLLGQLREKARKARKAKQEAANATPVL